MPTCNKCHPTFDLGRICPHEGPGLEIWEQGRTAGRAEGATILLDLIAELRGYQEDLDATEHALDSFGGCLCDELGQADRCTMHNLRMVARMADRAEERLREVSDE